jgi:hypothetical protein
MDDRTLEPRASRDATDQDDRHRYHSSLTPTGVAIMELKEPSVGKLAHMIKAGACMETRCKRGWGEVRMAAYQVRFWQGGITTSPCP